MQLCVDREARHATSMQRRVWSMPRSASFSGIAFFACLLLLACCLQADVVDAAIRRIAYIGNSYVYVQDLPSIFAAVVQSGTGAAAPTIGQSCPGGYRLNQHVALPATQALIDQGNWDVVILQEQSQWPAFAETFDGNADDFLAGAAGLCTRIRQTSPNAAIYFYQTWARHANCWTSQQADCQSVGADRFEMQRRLRKWYGIASQLAACAGSAVIPAGDAWELNYNSANAVRLHQSDNSHPEFNGAYLTALAFYKTVCQASSLNIAYTGSLSAAQAAHLKSIAASLSSASTVAASGNVNCAAVPAATTPVPTTPETTTARPATIPPSAADSVGASDTAAPPKTSAGTLCVPVSHFILVLLCASLAQLL